MSNQVKSLYLATNLEGLNALALNKQSLIADSPPKSLASFAQTLFEEARKAEGWERDEEKAYVIFLRYLSTVIQVKNTSLTVSSTEKKYCDEILEQNKNKIFEATGYVGRLKENLKKRYDIINAPSSSSSTNTPPNSTDSSKDTSPGSSNVTTITKKTSSLENKSVTPSFDRNLKPSRKNSVPDQQQQQDRSHAKFLTSQKNSSSCRWCDTPFQSDSPYFLSSDGHDIICNTCYNCTMGFGSPSTSNSTSTPQVINFNIHNSNVTVVDNNNGGPTASASNTDNWSEFFSDNFMNHCNIGTKSSDNYSKISEKDWGNDIEKLKRSTSASAWDPVKESAKESSTTTSSSECVICQDEESECCCVPCGHFCMCVGCSEQYKKSKSQFEGQSLDCPICRSPSTGIYKVYKV